MHLRHLGLPVRDAQRSLGFSAGYFGFDPASARTCDDGTLIVSDADGFDLALHPQDEVGPPPAFLHFGFGLDDPDAVRRLLDRMRADGVPTIEADDEPPYVGFKCADPDGHRVESYWEPPRPAR